MAGQTHSDGKRFGPADFVGGFAVLVIMGVLTFAAYTISHTFGVIVAVLLVACVVHAGWRDTHAPKPRASGAGGAPPSDAAAPIAGEADTAPVA